MMYRHVFDMISREFCGILHVFVNFAGFRGFNRIAFQTLLVCIESYRELVFERCLLVVVRKFQDKFASLRQLNNPNSRDTCKFQNVY